MGDVDDMVEPIRRRMPPERDSRVRKFTLKLAHQEIVQNDDGSYTVRPVDVDGYITPGVYPDGRLGEIFFTIGKQGGWWRIYDCFFTAISIGLQYGIPLRVYAEKFMYTDFEPHGFTTDDEIPKASSIVDYVFKWLSIKFPGGVNKDMAKKKDDKIGAD